MAGFSMTISKTCCIMIIGAGVGIGRQETLKMSCPKGVRVRFPLRAPGLSYSNTTPPSQGVYALYRISIFEVNLQLAEDWIYYVFTDQRHLRIKHY